MTSTRHRLLLLLALVASTALGAAPAAAQLGFGGDDEDGPISIGGNVKTFGVGSQPYEHVLLPDDPSLAGFAVGRLKVELNGGDLVRAEFHPLITALTGGGQTGGFTQFGVGASRPEAVDLSYDYANSGLGTLGMIVDRANVTLRIPHFELTLGRQAMSFGKGYFFTPMDLVAPFSPATIDREYKPGVDAVRGDVYFGTAGRFTVVAAYQGGWDMRGMVYAAHLGTTFAGWDMGVFAAESRSDHVVGFDLQGALLGVGLRSEVTATFPWDGDIDDDDERITRKLQAPFIRAVGGVDILLPAGVSMLGEVYWQTLGESDPDDYLAFAQSDRFARGELWLMGQLYAAGSVGWELNPLLRPGVSGVINLTDGSFFLSPSISWSVSDEVMLAAGAQIAQGERPDDIPPEAFFNEDGTPKTEQEVGALFVPKSEFGLYPNVGFLQISVYF